MWHAPLNISDLITMEEEFLDNVYFAHCFNISPKGNLKNWYDFNSKAIWIEIGIALIQVDQGPWSQCIQEHQSGIWIWTVPSWSNKSFEQ